MSTETRLLALVAEEKLVRFQPIYRGAERERRRLYISKDICDWLDEPVSTRALKDSKAKMRVHFGQFVKGERVDDCDYMKRVEDRRPTRDRWAHETWSVSPRFNPQYRFFGSFPGPDCLAIFCKQSRDYLDRDPNNWFKQIDKCGRAWAALFPGLRPYSGTSFGHYVTFDWEHCDDRW